MRTEMNVVDAVYGLKRLKDNYRRGVDVEEAVTINRPSSELYNFWRRFSELPRVMDHLVSVTCSRDGSSATPVAKAPAGRTVEWDARSSTTSPTS